MSEKKFKLAFNGYKTEFVFPANATLPELLDIINNLEVTDAADDDWKNDDEIVVQVDGKEIQTKSDDYIRAQIKREFKTNVSDMNQNVQESLDNMKKFQFTMVNPKDVLLPNLVTDLQKEIEGKPASKKSKAKKSDYPNIVKQGVKARQSSLQLKIKDEKSKKLKPSISG